MLVSLLGSGSALAAPVLRITEWMYNGANGNEFIELTNVGDGVLDLTGWSFSDNTELPGNVPLGSLGSLAAGRSALIVERDAASFRAAWNVAADVPILGLNSQNLGRADEINFYKGSDPVADLVDRLTYNDAGGLGPRTSNVSGNIPLAALGLNQPNAAVLSSVGDAYGSIRSTDGDVGNPGRYAPVPEPGFALLVALGLFGVAFLRRRPAVVALGASALALAGPAAATPYYIGTGLLPGTLTDGSGLTRTLEDGVTPENRVGGLGSAIAYTGVGTSYVATPDRGPADGATTYADRYYTLDVQVDAAARTVTPTLTATTLLKNESSQQLIGSSAAFDATNSSASLRFDPEGVRATRTGTFWISDEYGPFVYEFDASGQRLRSFALPSSYLISNPNGSARSSSRPATPAGVRRTAAWKVSRSAPTARAWSARCRAR